MAPASFAGLPAHVEALVGRGERVLLILLDAFGWDFVQRHGRHPLLRRLDAVEPMTAQFPSTTTAHVTTMHTGLPVGAHGLYEWNVLEPSLQRIITPLRATYAGDDEGDALLRDGFDLAGLLPETPRLYERLEVPCWVFQPTRFSPSSFDHVATPGAALSPHGDLEPAVAAAVAELQGVDAGYAYVYYDLIDATGHRHGPSSEAFDERVRSALDAVQAGLREAAG